MKNASELLNELYEEIKKQCPGFSKKQFVPGGPLYCGVLFTNNGNSSGYGFKVFKDFFKVKVGVKDNFVTGKFEDHVFSLPEQYEQARARIFMLLGIAESNLEAIKDAVMDFSKQLENNGLDLKPIENNDGIIKRFLSKYDESYAPIVISFDDDKHNAYINIKKYVPLASEKNRAEKGCAIYDLMKSRDTNFINPIEKTTILLLTIDLYNSVVQSPLYSTIKEIALNYGLKILDVYGYDYECKIVFSDGFEFSVLKSKGKPIIRAKNKITTQTVDYEFSETGIYEAFDFLFKFNKAPTTHTATKSKVSFLTAKAKIKKGETVKIEYVGEGKISFSSSDGKIVSIKEGAVTGISPGLARVYIKNEYYSDSCDIEVEETISLPPLSHFAQAFVNDVVNLKSDATKDDLDSLFKQYDELDDSECDDERVKEAYRLISFFGSENSPTPESVRFVYASKAFLKQIESLEPSYANSLDEIKKALNTYKSDKLTDFLLLKHLVYIDGYLKIRVKNGDKHRIIFCFGDKLSKNKKDIYIFNYNTTHDFSGIKYLHPEEQQYSLWSLEKPEIVVPPLTQTQEHISTSVDKPLICTGCAGSGKTLISVYMYIYLLDRDFGGDATIDYHNLVYVTYNDNARDNAAKQITEVVERANTKTIYDFFYDIAKPDLEGLKYADENEFTRWWKYEITDHVFKNKMYDLSKANPIKYVYTFYRGLYKGSMFYWKLTYSDRSLNRVQFDNLLSKEPVEKSKVDLIFTICELYDEYLRKNKMFDDNDLARMAARRLENKLSKKYGHIIIDEVQDLTEVQLDALVKASEDKQKLYFFGDQNQSINPTLFNLDFIEMCLLTNNSYIDTDDTHKLTNSYRFGPHLAKYINELVALKQKWIGTLALIETEGSNKDSEKNRWAGRSSDEEVINNMLLKASNSSNAIIIVPDSVVKEQLRNKYGDIFAKRVTTIYDSKGLEWDYVILFNMLKFNEDKYEEMIEGKGKYSTLHRMIFNQYYVGCTRALSCFTVLETDLDNKIEEAILGDLQVINNHNLNLFIEEKNDANSWFEEANRLFDAGIYDLALSAYEKAELTPEEEPKMEICSFLLSPESKADITIAEYCKQNGFYKEASLVYQNAGKHRLSQLMNLYVGINISDEDAWEILNNEELSDMDMETINKSGFLTKKSDKIKERMKSLERELKGK